MLSFEYTFCFNYRYLKYGIRYFASKAELTQ